MEISILQKIGLKILLWKLVEKVGDKMRPKLFITYDRSPKNKEICNCTMCPVLGNSRFAGQEFSRWNYCDIQEGLIKEPVWCWCAVGIGLMWMDSHSASEGVDMMLGLVSMAETESEDQK